MDKANEQLQIDLQRKIVQDILSAVMRTIELAPPDMHVGMLLQAGGTCFELAAQITERQAGREDDGRPSVLSVLMLMMLCVRGYFSENPVNVRQTKEMAVEDVRMMGEAGILDRLQRGLP